MSNNNYTLTEDEMYSLNYTSSISMKQRKTNVKEDQTPPNKLPLVSDSYETDEKIMEYCNKFKSDKKCKCVIPEEGIFKLQVNLFNPYYCWYEPCASGDAYITSIIKEERKKCNIVLCNVELGQVSLDDNGVLNVKNNCISSKNFSSVVISKELLEPSLKQDYVLPDYFSRTALPLLLGLGLIFFLKT